MAMATRGAPSLLLALGIAILSIAATSTSAAEEEQAGARQVAGWVLRRAFPKELD